MEMIRLFTTEKVHLILCWITASDHYYCTIRSLGFVRYNSMPLIAFGPLARHSSTAAARWHFTVADSDNI